MKDFFTVQLFVRLITSFICSVAFAIVYKINKKHVLLGVVGGFLTWFTMRYSFS